MARKSYVQRLCRSLFTRALSSLLLITAVMTVGTLGMYYFEGLPYIDAFYFMSMLATAQGPTSTPATFAGKIFASIMAFISVGSIVTALGFILGPFFGVFLKMEAERVEKEIQVHVLKKEAHEKS